MINQRCILHSKLCCYLLIFLQQTKSSVVHAANFATVIDEDIETYTNFLGNDGAQNWTKIQNASKAEQNSTTPAQLLRTKRAHFSLFPRTVKWTSPEQIRWTFDPQFPELSKLYVREAFRLIDADLFLCVNFVEFATAAAIPRDGINQNDYIIVTNRQRPNGQGDTTVPTICAANPGRMFGQIGQRLSIVTQPRTTPAGADTGFIGCTDNARVMVGLIYQMLGFYGEMNRFDRDNFVTIYFDRMSQAARDAGVYQRVYSPTDGTPIGSFDRNSITIEPTRFFSAQSALQDVIESKNMDRFIFGNNPNLSYLDCVAATVLYRVRNIMCDYKKCPP